jgi:hypothetical protein
VVNEVRQTEIHRAEPPFPEPSAFDDELATEELRIHNSSGFVQIQAEFIKTAGWKKSQ